MCFWSSVNGVLGFCHFCAAPSLQAVTEYICTVSSMDQYGKRSSKDYKYLDGTDGRRRDWTQDPQSLLPQDDWFCMRDKQPPFPVGLLPQRQLPFRITQVPAWPDTPGELGYIENQPPWDPELPCLRCVDEKTFCEYWVNMRHLVPPAEHRFLRRWLRARGLGPLESPIIPTLSPVVVYTRPMQNEWLPEWLNARSLLCSVHWICINLRTT